METEGPKPIRSLHSDIPKFVIFVNRTNKLARAWWLDFSGNPVSYGDIPPNGELHMNTFISTWTGRCGNRAKSI